MRTDGTKIEDSIIRELDGKTYYQLDQNYRNIIDTLWEFPDKDEIIHCENTKNCIKPDVMITYKGERKGLSIKSGNAHVVQTQYVKTFAKFLYDHGVSKETLKTLLLVHYGDGTCNGTGKERLEHQEVYTLLKDRVKAANDELNNNFELMKEVVDYCIFDGVDPEADKAEAIYFGDEVFGYCANRYQFHKWIDRKPWTYMNYLHVGPIMIRAHARYAKKKILDPDAREHCTLYLPNLANDVAYVSRHYTPFASAYKRMDDNYKSFKENIFKEHDEFMDELFKDDSKLAPENSGLEQDLEKDRVKNQFESEKDEDEDIFVRCSLSEFSKKRKK